MSTKRVVHHGNSTELKEESMKYAKKLRELRQGITESRVRQNICRILDDYDFENYTEHPVRGGRVDIYMPRHRVVIETKAPGSVSREDKAQVSRYVDRLAKEEWGIFSNDEKLPDFTGILTDGQVWYAWKYHTDTGKEIGQVLDGIRPQNARSLLRKFLFLWDHQPFGKPGIPDNPREEFQSHLDSLRDVYEGLSGPRRAHTDTKLSLWLDMLRTSSMAPTRRSAQERLFVSHTFLVSLAKGVIHTVVAPNRDPSAKDLLGEGFIAWVLDSNKGREWARDFLREINGWDWTRRQGDVLRPLYEAFVDEKDRKSFGEFYTPDWLAQLMVEEVLDDDWCKKAVKSALSAQYDPDALNGVGVLDPACGSGTFLYFAAKRLMESEVMTELGLSHVEKSSAVAKLVNGIDVHPVAAEMARATLMRALRWAPGEGMSFLRIYEGDSLQVRKRGTELFTPDENRILFESPKGRSILLPRSFIYRTDFANLIRRLVETAVAEGDCPEDIVASTDSEEQETIREAHKNLVKIIQNEGDSVWTWYIVNMAGPYQLFQRKVDRIVANPPWVSMAGIQDTARKRALEAFAQNESGIWSGGRNAPHFDIAQLFMKRCRELYLVNPGHNPSAWLVKLAALTSGGWETFRENYHRKILWQSLDLTEAQPFGGGDARRCCVMFEYRKVSLLPAISQIPKAIVRLTEPRIRPKSHMNKEEALRLLFFEAAPQPFPDSPSDYHGFRMGATITPKVLTLVDKTIEITERECTIITAESMHLPWREVQPQQGTFPRKWIKRTLRSQKLFPFTIDSALDSTIIPMDPDGLHLSSAPGRVSPSWCKFDEMYGEYRGQGNSTPQTLISQVDNRKHITVQLKAYREECRGEPTKVVYPTCGDIMRAARMIPSKAIVDSSIYWFIARNEDEAAYLVGVLNSSALTKAFADSRTSGRTFHKNPWRKIPIPQFQSNNNIHGSIAEVTRRAESLATTIINSSNEKNGGGGKLVYLVASENYWTARVSWASSTGWSV